MTRPTVVIVGAGLGGSMLAHVLADTHDVTVIERGAAVIDPRFPVVDIGWPARTEPHFGSGPGGSTQLWHNGLIEIDEETFTSAWPIRKEDLDPYYEKAFLLLSGVPRERVTAAILELRKKYLNFGIPAADLPGLYYPRSPMNLWQGLKLDGRVKLIRGDVTGFETFRETAGQDRVVALEVSAEGRRMRVAGDTVVLAAGGLGTPILLQKLARTFDAPALGHAGFHYEDHPMGFAGEVELSAPLYQLWNYQVPEAGGNLRLPLVVTRNGMQFSFQLRPAATYYRKHRRERVGSVLHKLRRNPWNPLHYAGLLSHWDDVLDILSFKLGIRLPTRHYTLLMMAQMPPSEDCSIWSEIDPRTGKERRVRRWTLTQNFQDDLHAALDAVLHELAPVTRNTRIFPDWIAGLATGAHHSGTARMAKDAESGVCDGNCRVFGLENLYICDGSVIPASGIANTGLTIGALALRLARHLSQPIKIPLEMAE